MQEPGAATSSLVRSHDAPPPRTLVDVLRTTVALAPDEPALDNGSTVLTYAELAEAADEVAVRLAEAGIGRGGRVGIRIPSGTTDLYVAVLGVLVAGAAYVPVDVDDPVERARTVLGEAAVDAVLGEGLAITTTSPGAPVQPEEPGTADDAWIIFTSGSTGVPKGVAVSHRSAAAFVDAEASLFCREAPLGPGDRVMAGLSVAFDASCEEMWLAWRHGACLVPAPRSLVKSGTDLGPWLVANRVTVVSTVPTLVSLWPTEALDAVRLLILGGEACPPEIGARLARPGREVWNTYGPTEATVVACAAPVGPRGPVRIGLPLAGWDLAVVDEHEEPVPPGTAGQLVIGGVGLARYLDPEKDAERYAPMPALGWSRAYRSGDVVVHDEEGLVFVGRADDQVKIGGRRIELGEVDDALLALPGVRAAATAVRRTAAGNAVLVGYVTVDDGFDAGAAHDALRSRLPAASVPRVAVVEDMPSRTSGKIDRDALPWPVGDPSAAATLAGTAAELAALWLDILGTAPTSREDDFFVAGGGSLTAAQLVARLRETHPGVAVADVYEAPTVGGLADRLDEMTPSTGARTRRVPPVPGRSQAAQLLAMLPLAALGSLRGLAWTALGTRVAVDALGWSWVPAPSWPLVLLALLLVVSPPGRMLLAVLLVRALVRPVTPGAHPRGGRVHLRVWLAERVVEELAADSSAGAALLPTFARLLGARVARDVDLHALPPVTGMLEVGKGAAVEPEVDLSGTWVEGGTFHVGAVVVAPHARVGVRSTVGPGVRVGAGAEVGPGSTVLDDVPDGMFASGAPAVVVGPTRGPLEPRRAPRHRAWTVAYGVAGALVAALPGAACAVGAWVALTLVGTPAGPGEALAAAVLLVPLGALVAFGVLALAVLVLVRALSAGITSGVHPVHGAAAWCAWLVLRILDEARGWLFVLYSSSLTPAWLRALGADIGRDVEASTVLMVPSLTTVKDGAFLADDTMLGMYELGAGWLRVERVRIGRHAFVGNSGMAAPGRKVPKGGLVAVLSAAPRRAKAKKGTSWLGSPPTRLRRATGDSDAGRTYEPRRALRVARAAWELARLVAVVLSALLYVLVVAAFVGAAATWGWWAAALVAGPALLAAGVVAAAAATAAKWLLVGRVRVGEHPLWSSFVWRNELADSFVEVLAAPWFCRRTLGTPLLSAWLRSLGASIGRGVWCESHWLPEADLVRLGDGATVNRGCVVQTHLFHDRILSMDQVELEPGATLGPHGVVLPAASLRAHATVGPGSLVMRGEVVPSRTRWLGNPIGPWEPA